MIDHLHHGPDFNLGEKNKICQHYSLKEHIEINKAAKFGRKMM